MRIDNSRIGKTKIAIISDYVQTYDDFLLLVQYKKSKVSAAVKLH